MAESYSVKAVLCAEDKNFSSMMKSCSSYAENLKNTLTSGIGFGAMAAIGSKAVSAVGSGLKSLTTGAISAGANFENAMSSVAAISGATGSDFDRLSEKAKQLGKSTQYTASETASAMEYMAMAGWKTEDMLNGIEGVMDLAAASGEDLTGVSDIVTDAMTAFGLSADGTTKIIKDGFTKEVSNASHFADVLAAASANSNTNVAMLGESFKYAAPVAGSLGYSVEDTAIALGLMASSGLKSSMAGSSLRTILTNLAKPTDDISDAMDYLGISLQNGDGSMKSLMDIVTDLRGAFGQCKMPMDQFQENLAKLDEKYANGELTEKKYNEALADLTEKAYGAEGALKAKYAATLAGKEGMSGLLSIVSAAPEDFDKLTNAIYNSDGAAKEMAEIKMDNLQHDVVKLQSAMEGLGITAFNQVGGKMRGLVGIATEAVGKIDEKLASGKGIEKAVDKIEAMVEKAKPYWDIFKTDAVEAGTALGDAAGAIIGDIKKLSGSFGSTESIENFSTILGKVKDGTVAVSGFLEKHSDVIAKLVVTLPKLLIAYKGFKIVKAVAPFVGAFTGAVGGLAKAGLGKIAPGLFKVSKGQEAVGKSSGGSAKKMVASAKAFMMMGVGVLAISAGFYLLAQSAIAVTNAGPGAIAVFGGLIGVVVGLAVGMTKMLSSMSGGSKKLTAMTPALLALGAAVLMISAGLALLAYSSIQLANAGPLAIGCMAGMVVALAGLMLVAKNVAPTLSAGAVGFVAFGASVLIAAAGIGLLSLAAINLANAGPLAIGCMAGMVVALAGLMLVAKNVAPTLSAGAVGFVAFGASVLIAAAGIGLLSLAAINLANAGPLAIGCMVGMVAAIALLAVGAAALGSALTVGAVGFIAFGAAIVLVAAGALIASAALAVVSAVLPSIVQYGSQGAVAIAQLGASMIVFGTGAAVGGIGATALGVGLALVGVTALVAAAGVIVLAAGAAVLGASLVMAGAGLTIMGAAFPLVAAGAKVSAAGLAALLGSGTAASAVFVILAGSSGAAAVTVGVFAAAMVAGAAGTGLMVVALKSVNSSMKSIAGNAKSAEKSLTSMKSSVNVVNSGLDALGNKAKNAISALIKQFSQGESKAKTSGKAVGNNFNNGVSAGMSKAVSTAGTMSNSIVITMRSSAGGAYNSGAYIGMGLANGMASQVGHVRAVAAQLAAAAEAAIRARAQIHSPSRVTDKLGNYFGIGWVNGIMDHVQEARQAAMELIQVPELTPAPEIGMSLRSGYEDLNDDSYQYSSNGKYTIYVPVNLDGREIGKATATYTREEIEKQETRENRKKGRRINV